MFEGSLMELRPAPPGMRLRARTGGPDIAWAAMRAILDLTTSWHESPSDFRVSDRFSAYQQKWFFRSAQIFQSLIYRIPIYDVPECVEIVGAVVPIFQIVGVFPQVIDQKGGL